MRFIVTTRKEVLEQLKAEGYTLIGVNGTVPKSEGLYDHLFDHRRPNPNGADIQIQELKGAGICYPDKTAIVTTMVDADAICAAFYLKKYALVLRDEFELLEAISYDCDHLAVPERLSHYADDAAMIVAALKQATNPLVNELGLPSDRRTWTIDQKEEFSSAAFTQGVNRIDSLFDLVSGAEWDYKSLAKSYMDNLTKVTDELVNSDRIKLYRDCLLFDARGLGGRYIDPRCWLRAAKALGLESEQPITLVTRDVVINNEYKGLSHTLGCVPFHPKLSQLDFTKRTFTSLTEVEQQINPNCDPWGGRKTVGGSGWNTCSNLLPEQVIDIVLESLPPRCPSCDSENVVKAGKSRFGKQRWICRDCTRKFSY